LREVKKHGHVTDTLLVLLVLLLLALGCWSNFLFVLVYAMDCGYISSFHLYCYVGKVLIFCLPHAACEVCPNCVYYSLV